MLRLLIVLTREILAGGFALQLEADTRHASEEAWRDDRGNIRRGSLAPDGVHAEPPALGVVRSICAPWLHACCDARASRFAARRNTSTFMVPCMAKNEDRAGNRSLLQFPRTIFTNLSRTMMVLSTGLPATASRIFGVASAAFFQFGIRCAPFLPACDRAPCHLFARHIRLHPQSGDLRRRMAKTAQTRGHEIR